jgi:hypothetical protein
LNRFAARALREQEKVPALQSLARLHDFSLSSS